MTRRKEAGLVKRWVIDQGYFLGLMLAVTGAVCARLFYLLPFTTEKQTRRIFFRPWCWALGHEWADDSKWGVEPVCLTCGGRREVSES